MNPLERAPTGLVADAAYRMLVAKIQDYAIFMLDPEGRVLSWNEGARRIKGYEEHEIVGRHFSTFYSSDDVARSHPEENLAAAAKLGSFEEESWRIRKDGTRFWASVTLTALRDARGALTGFAKVTRDLTARRLAQEELQRTADENARLSRELEAFAYTVAHDLRAPLRAVRHLAESMNEDLEKNRLEDARRSASAVRSSAARMSDLVETLLQFALVPNAPLARLAVDVTQLVHEVYDDLVLRGAARPEALHVERGLAVEADAKLLRVVLENLLSNAAKYSRERDAPTIRVGVKNGAFFVEDNGIGFDASRADGVFRPFQRLHPLGTFEGIGVGLATAQRIVERHGGKLWADSAPGSGTTMWFTLPS